MIKKKTTASKLNGAAVCSNPDLFPIVWQTQTVWNKMKRMYKLWQTHDSPYNSKISCLLPFDNKTDGRHIKVSSISLNISQLSEWSKQLSSAQLKL